MKAAALLFTLTLAPAAWADTPATAETTQTCTTLAYLAADQHSATLKAAPNKNAQVVARVLDGRQMFCVVHRPEGGRHWNYVVALPPENTVYLSMWCTLNHVDDQNPLCGTPVLPALLQPEPRSADCRVRESRDADNNLNLHMQGSCAQGWISGKQLHILAE